MHACSVVSDCDPHGPKPTRLLCPWDSLGRNTGVGCLFPVRLQSHLIKDEISCKMVFIVMEKAIKLVKVPVHFESNKQELEPPSE